MSLWESFKEVVKPSAFRARLMEINEEQERLVRTLQLFDKPAIREITAATDKAAEFH
jgi:hypothetical protein